MTKALTRTGENGEKDLAPSSQSHIIAIIDPRTLIRECLALSLQEKLALPIATYPDITSWSAAQERFSACALVLLWMEGENAARCYDALRELSSSRHACLPVIILCDNPSMQSVVDALRHGAKGFIPTGMALEVASEAIGLVLAGGCFVPAHILDLGETDDADVSAQSVAPKDFTTRENQIVAALLKGKSNKVIAYDIGLAESSVKYHIRSVLRKLHARNRTEAVTKLSEVITISLSK
jgi:DNA-binding NarL/FixJ family response regulator